MYGLRIIGCRPIYETAFLEILAGAVHASRNLPEEPGNVFVLLLQIVQIPRIIIKVTLDNAPPHGVGTNAVHPFIGTGAVAREIQTLPNNVLAAEYRIDGHHLRMHVPNPYQAVAFDAIPDIVLHVEMYGVCSSLPYFV